MISRTEIESMSRQLGVHTSHVQRDYVHGWLLSLLYGSSSLADRLVLKGGNCLRKAYFESARYSRDLDFSTTTGISHVELGRELNSICAALHDRTGIEFDTERTRVEDKRGVSKDKTVSEARLYFKDFYGQESEIVLSVRVDVTQFDRLYLPVQGRNLIHPYSDAGACSTSIRCVQLEELLASKMRCLLQRRHIADLFDLVYATVVSDELEVNRSQLLSTFFRITIFGSSSGVAKGLFIDLPLEALSRFWEHISCPQQSWFSFDDARERFLRFIESLIPGRAIQEYSPVFFPSSLRNPIMDAADNLTLLRLRYSGVERLVEPYSLVFKIRKDGVAREYFYAYDTTGGTSGPGIKAFVPGKVESVDSTDQPFEPRFEVELRKAGGAETVDRFPRRTGMRRWHSRRSVRSSARYEIECPYCLRRFKRKRYNTKLKPHKDRYGNACYGRVGYLV